MISCQFLGVCEHIFFFFFENPPIFSLRKVSSVTRRALTVRRCLALLQVQSFVNCLWDTLLDLDDLTASTKSIMSLLATFLARPVKSADDGTE